MLGRNPDDIDVAVNKAVYHKQLIIAWPDRFPIAVILTFQS